MTHTEIAIVGAGAAGATLAAELAPVTSVTVVEAEEQAGYHASGRSAAVFVPSYGYGLLRRLTAMSREFFANTDSGFFPAPLLAPRGLLRLVLADGLEAHNAITAGVPGIHSLTPAEATEKFPLMNPGRIVHASYEEDVHDIDSDGLIQGCLQKVRASGGEVMRRWPVTEIRRSRGLWSLRSGEREIRCRVLVNAAGAWANNIASLAGVPPIRLQVSRRSIAVLPRPEALRGQPVLPFTVSFPLRWYVKDEPNSLLVSPADEDAVQPHDAFADDMVIAEGLHRFSEDTGFEVRRMTRSWAGLRSKTPDEYPVVGFDPRAQGFFWLAGQAGFGIQCAPALARLAANVIAGDHGDEALVRAFAVERASGPDHQVHAGPGL